MSDGKSKRKITRVDSGDAASHSDSERFVPTPEAKSKATKLRVFGVISWVIAIGCQLGAISLLFKEPVHMTWLIVLIVLDLVFVVTGALLWKKSNRLDPASEKDKVRFFIQNQLGLLAAIIAFLPLIVFIFTSKNLSGNQKKLAGGIAVVALLVAGFFGLELDPPSIEQYTEETKRVEWLNQGQNHVFWTRSGTVYHLYNDCSYITTDRTPEIFQGGVAQARELKNISRLCSRCENRAIRERELNEDDFLLEEDPANDQEHEEEHEEVGEEIEN